MEGYDGVALIFPDAAKASMLSDDIMKGAVEDKEFMDYLFDNNMIAFDRMKEPYLSSKQDSPLTLIATYGYAITGHKSQGSQWDNVYVDQGNERNWGPRWMYTAITRAAKNLTIKKSKFATLITPKQMKSKIDEVIRKNATAPVSAPDITKDLNQSTSEVKLGNETAPANGNVIIDNVKGKKPQPGAVVAFRTKGKTEQNMIDALKDNAVGNPFGPYGAIKEETAVSVTRFLDWLEGKGDTNVMQDYRNAILAKQNELTNKDIYYYKDLGRPSHATALDYFLNKSTQPAGEVSINTKRWTKDSPKENPTTAYVFTENINSIGDTRVGKGSAVIRNNPNAIGIVTKKYYFYSENRNTPQALKIKEEYKEKGEWYNQNFQDTNADFELFQKINLEQFDKLDQFDSKKFPDGFANSLASVPNRFALWLQNQLKTRYGLITEVNDKGTGLISKSVIESPQKTVKGISISSNSNDTLGATLTNPTELAKSKGKISKSYPITYKNKTYKDVEEAYQALKDTSESKTKPDRFKSKNYALMVDLLQTKLATYTELPTAITAQGGTPWILGSTHQPTNQNTVWETGGQNWFIEALNESYTLVQSSLQSRDIDTSVKNLFTITPIQGRPDQKASVKASIATQYIGFADNIAGSSTANYAKQAGPFANTGQYNSDDVIFVSIGGERGAKKFRLAAQKKTISEAAFAVDSGAVIITDNKAYTFDPKNTYNSGERMLFETMTQLGFLYNEITIDGEVLGTWRLFDGSERKIQSKLVKSGDRSGYTTYPNFQQSVSSIKKYIPKGIMIVNGSIDPNDKPGTRTNDELILKEQINSLPLISMASYGLKSGQAFSNVIKDIEVNGVMKIDPKVQEAIDDRLDAIENRVSEDNVLEFSSEGYGMDMLKTLPNSEKRIGVQTWLYLSEELFKRFGYINPGYNTSASGSAVIESVNQDVSEQELIEKSDQAVLDFMKMCKI